MTIEDYEAALALWQTSEGIGLSAADERGPIQRFLERNPGLSVVAVDIQRGQVVVGAALCGHDGRRGYLHHVAVRHDYRGQGLGRVLVDRCLDALRAEGISKCHLFVYTENHRGRAFWASTGWQERTTLLIYSRDL